MVQGALQRFQSALSIPEYIQRAGLNTKLLEFDWADERTIPALVTPDSQLVASLRGLSVRAIVAYMCGVTEWIHHRLSHLCEESAPEEFLEAIWAKSVHIKYAGYGEGSLWWEHYADDWCGPVKGPIHDAFLAVETNFRALALEGRLSERRAALLSSLAIHVLADAKLFHAWSASVLDRLKGLYPRRSEDPLGDVVPRQAVDPDRSFKEEECEDLINVFLTKLNHKANRFLSTPEGMLTRYGDNLGFEGTPYMFVMAHDRRLRDRFGVVASPL